MQVVSGPVGRRRVHFEALPAERLETEMAAFLDWLDQDSGDPPLIKAALGHLWFVTLHPFDDGNGRSMRCWPTARFWQRVAGTPMNARQVKLVNCLLDGLEGKLTSGKWSAIAKSSADTALRDITELVERGVLRKSAAGGRSTSYELIGGPPGPS